jgi:hypothetical protein
MSQRITITISIDVPAGASVNVGNGAEMEDAPWPGSAGPALPPPSRVLTAGPGDCPVHRVPFTFKEGGVSKAGKPYDGFWKCGEKNADDTYCTQRPPR